MSVVPTQIPVSTSVPALTLAAGTTGGVAVANSIDPVNDYALIYTASATATQGINRNTYLGISSQPLGKTDVQTGISNKTFVAPVLGAATATSINGLTLTSSTGTISITNGKTLAVSNSLTLAGTDSTTMTFPSSSDTVVGLGATQTLTNKTLTSPIIGTSILDTNSNVLLGLTATASAVNYATLAGSATGNAPTIAVAGSDTNIGIKFAPKGTGQITGVVQALTNPYKFSVYQTSSQSVGTSSTLITFNTKEFDTGTNFSTSTNLFTAPIAGFYSFSSYVGVAAASSTTRAAISIYKNGSEVKRGNDISGTNVVYGLGVSIPQIQLSANDTIGIYIFTVGAATTVEGGETTAWFSGGLESST